MMIRRDGRTGNEGTTATDPVAEERVSRSKNSVATAIVGLARGQVKLSRGREGLLVGKACVAAKDERSEEPICA